MPKLFAEFVRTRGRITIIDSRRVNTDDNLITVYESGTDMLEDLIETGLLDASDPDKYIVWLQSKVNKMRREVRKANA